MRTAILAAATVSALALAGCKSTLVGERLVDTEVAEGPGRVVSAKEVKEENGVTSGPAGAQSSPVPTGALETGPARGTPPVEPRAPGGTDEAAKKEELERPPFEPSRRADQVDSGKAQELLRDMKAEARDEQARRAKRIEELASQVQEACASRENAEKAQKRFEEAELLYSQQKREDAVKAYLEVLDFVPRHKAALARLRQCYADMDSAARPAPARPPAAPQDVLLLEQKYASALRLYEEGKLEDALKKFTEAVEMIERSPGEIDTKGLLAKAREYVERIRVERELSDKKPQEEPSRSKPAGEPKTPEPSGGGGQPGR
jgi:hypothetical protein